MADKEVVHIIDDDDALRELLAFLLGTAGIEGKTYASAKAFLDTLPDLSLSCVITDVRMPDMSGIDLLRRFKETQDRRAGDRRHRPWRCRARCRSHENRRG